MFALGKQHDDVSDKHGLGAVVHMNICDLITLSSLDGTRHTLRVMKERPCFPPFFFFPSSPTAARGGMTVATLADPTVTRTATQPGQVPQRVRSDRGTEIRGLRLE